MVGRDELNVTIPTWFAKTVARDSTGELGIWNRRAWKFPGFDVI